MWEFNASGTIYSNPRIMKNSVAVCTTAGDVIQLDAVNGEELWRRRVQGEIWSDPVVVESESLIVWGTRFAITHDDNRY